jgi:SpoVK/Ycf46/Vps4 family AAA+-type ATPase
MDYYIAPAFLDKLAVHITKNYLDLPGVKVPLILGVHGRKGEGKTFQCELVFDRMKVEAIHISAGELESPDAGDSARLIRLRYREAAEIIKVRGKMAVLVINDIDAGAGRFDRGTQYTVNTQLVNATLMNIADNPTNVQLPGSYDAKPLPRIPIILTGNDLSTLYAPLIRDGRMDKFYWVPTREDKIEIVCGVFAPDDLSRRDIINLVDRYAEQAIDFFAAIRARIYDEQIREFIHTIGLHRVGMEVVNPANGVAPSFPKPHFTIDRLIEFGDLLVQEQKSVAEGRLVEEYNRVRYAK